MNNAIRHCNGDVTQTNGHSNSLSLGNFHEFVSANFLTSSSRIMTDWTRSEEIRAAGRSFVSTRRSLRRCYLGHAHDTRANRGAPKDLWPPCFMTRTLRRGAKWSAGSMAMSVSASRWPIPSPRRSTDASFHTTNWGNATLSTRLLCQYLNFV